MTPAVCVIWNPSASRAADATAVRRAVSACAHTELVVPTSAAEARERAREAGDRGADLVVAAGGDGTINAVAQGVLEQASPCPLGLLPVGTANDLCRTLGVPLDPESALALWSEPRVCHIDVIEVRHGERQALTVNLAAGGNSPRIHQVLTPEQKARWGTWCYLRGALSIVPDLGVFETMLRIDDGPPERVELLNILVANGRWAAGGIALAPDADPEDGALDVVLVRDGAPLDLVATATQLLAEDYRRSDLVTCRRGRDLQLESHPSLPFSVDGDLLDFSPTRFSVWPRALPVVVGPTYAPGAPRA